MKKAILLFAIVAQAYGQPLVEVARKMKAIEGMQPQINDMERRIGIKESVNPVLDNAIALLENITDVRGMGRRRLLWDDIPDLTPTQEYVLGSMQEHVNDIHEKLMVLKDMPRVPVDVPSVAVSDSRRRLTSRAWDTKLHSCQQCAKGVESTCESLSEFTCDTLVWKVQSAVDDNQNKCDKEKNHLQTLFDKCDKERAMLIPKLAYFEGGGHAWNNTARKMKAVEGFQPQINDMERRLGIMQSVEPVLENGIKTLQKVIDIRGMGRRLSDDGADLNIVKEWSLQSSADWPEAFSWDGEKFPEHRTPLQRVSDMHIMLDYILANMNTPKISGSTPMLRAKMLRSPVDDGQPLVEVARKMKAIEDMQPQINDMERRLIIMQSVEPILENAIKTLQKVIDVRGM